MADPAQPVEIVSAVSAGATGGASRGEQAAGLVGAQVLGASADQFGGDRDAVHAAAAVELCMRQSDQSPFVDVASCLSMTREL